MTVRRFYVNYNHDNSKIVNDLSYRPLDGKNVLVKVPAGWWITAWFCKDDFCWVCGDDTFTLAIDEVSHWMEVPPEETPEETKKLDEERNNWRIKDLLWRIDTETKKNKQ